MTIFEIDISDYTVYKNRKLIKKLDHETTAWALWDLARYLSDPNAKNAVWIKEGSSINSEFHISDDDIDYFLEKINEAKKFCAIDWDLYGYTTKWDLDPDWGDEQYVAPFPGKADDDPYDPYY